MKSFSRRYLHEITYILSIVWFNNLIISLYIRATVGNLVTKINILNYCISHSCMQCIKETAPVYNFIYFFTVLCWATSHRRARTFCLQT